MLAVAGVSPVNLFTKTFYAAVGSHRNFNPCTSGFQINAEHLPLTVSGENTHAGGDTIGPVSAQYGLVISGYDDLKIRIKKGKKGWLERQCPGGRRGHERHGPTRPFRPPADRYDRNFQFDYFYRRR